jgi:hypothetical protein
MIKYIPVPIIIEMTHSLATVTTTWNRPAKFLRENMLMKTRIPKGYLKIWRSPATSKDLRLLTKC